MNSEIFLQKYRVLEGLLEKRYEGRRISSSSVIIEYIREDDSEPVRVDLDLLREIRNILSHNAGSDGAPVVEPSSEMLRRLDEIIEYVSRPRRAVAFGTPAEHIFSAHPNDNVFDVMRTMRKRGFSHAPVREKNGVIGVFSTRCVFEYLADHGLDSLNASSRVEELEEYYRLDRGTGDRYEFVPAHTSIIRVRNDFRMQKEQNRRLSAVFVTQNGSPQEELICMLTPWNVLSSHPSMKENNHGTGKA